MKKIKASGLDRLFAAISETKELYLPVRGEKDVSYKLWSEGTEYAADALNTVKSPKDLFFPQSENLYAMKTTEGGRKIDLVDNSYGGRDFVVFGVRACDAASFGILDRVFLSNPVDAYYKARREKGVVVTVACREPETSCFCHTFGIDPAEPAGDVSCIFAGDSLYLDAKTEKGAALLDSLGVLEDAADADLDVVEAEKTVARDNLAKTPLYDLTTEASAPARPWSCSALRSGQSSPRHASAAAPAPSFAPPASAMISATMTPVTVFRDTAAGIPACSPSSPVCPRVSRDSRRSKDSARDSCTSWSTIPKTTRACSPASAAADAL